MQASKRLINYARDVYSNNLIDSMKRYKILDDLMLFDVMIKESSDLDLGTIKEIYRLVIKRYINKYGNG